MHMGRLCSGKGRLCSADLSPDLWLVIRQDTAKFPFLHSDSHIKVYYFDIL